MPLSPCARCSRHVAADAARCPFCGASDPRPAPPRPGRAAARAGRAAVLLAGVLGAGGCGGTVYGGPPDRDEPASREASSGDDDASPDGAEAADEAE